MRRARGGRRGASRRRLSGRCGGGNGGDADTLYFLDGIDGDTAGLFGAVAAVPEPEAWLLHATGLAAVGLRRRRAAPAAPASGPQSL